MTPTLILLNIVAGVCLLLWGVTLLRLGVTYGFGADLRRILAASTSNRIKSFLAGMGITALLQSSTATILIVATFVGQGMIKATASLAMVLGADVGTTLVAQFFTLDLRFLAPLFMIVGYILFKIKNPALLKNIGRILVGAALMLFALGWIREAAEPLKSSQILPTLLGALQKDPVFAVFIAALLTWLAHSSLAIVLLLVSFVAAGVLPLPVGLFMVLGSNLGGTLPALLASLSEQQADARRIPLGNLFMRFIGVFGGFAFLTFYGERFFSGEEDVSRNIVNFHMAFNIVLALIFLPFTGLVYNLTRLVVPDTAEQDDPTQARYLNNKDLSIPSVALAAATRETLRIADIVQEMLEDSMRVFQTNDEVLLEKVKKDDDTIDRLYLQIKHYMASLSQEFFTPQEAERYVQILTFSTNLEHAGDVIDKNLMPLAQKKIRRQIEFSKNGFNEILQIHKMVVDSVQLAQSVFVSSDKAMAAKLLEDKRKIKKAESLAMETHIERLGDGVPETINSSSLHVDIIRDYRRINSYVSSVAYSLLEDKTGEKS